jgi:hypothetical protein
MSYDLKKLKVAVKMILHSSHQNAIVGKIYHTYIFSAKKTVQLKLNTRQTFSSKQYGSLQSAPFEGFPISCMM